MREIGYLELRGVFEFEFGVEGNTKDSANSPLGIIDF